jgi:O-antigen/teichoic acid export membrane protein
MIAHRAPPTHVKTQLVAPGRQTLTYGLGNVAVQAVGLLTLPVFARVFSQAEYGVLELATVTPAAVAILADVGLASGSQRSWFEYTDEQHRSVTHDRAALGGALLPLGALDLHPIGLALLLKAAALAVFVLALVRLGIVRRTELVDVARALRLRAGAS